MTVFAPDARFAPSSRPHTAPILAPLNPRGAQDCGGGSICVHRRIRSVCKECGGGSICVHQRERAYCKECGGSQICVHGRIRYYCRDCGGKGICIHGKRRKTGACKHGC